MKSTYVLYLLMIFSLACIIYPMNEKREQSHITKCSEIIWLKPQNKKSIPMHYQDACYSSYVGILKTIDPIKGSKHFPIRINLNKKEINFFTTIIRQPSLYKDTERMPEKQYHQALHIAERLAIPLLYSELLEARYPQPVIKLITEKYIALSQVKEKLLEKKRKNLWAQAELILNDKKNLSFKVKSEIQIHQLDQKLTHIMTDITLTQIILLSMLNNEHSNGYTIYITPYRPGYESIITWDNQKKLEVLFEIFNFNYICKQSKTGLERLVSLDFNA